MISTAAAESGMDMGQRPGMSLSDTYALAMAEVPRTEPEFVDWLIARHPGLASILEEHLSGNHGELLAPRVRERCRESG